MLQWIKTSLPFQRGERAAFSNQIQQITGCKPKDVALYKLAFRHSSAPAKNNTTRYSNERLEYLGDAILGAIVANYLYHRFPEKEEGFLTNMRSKIVRRQSLNALAVELGIPDLLVRGKVENRNAKSLYGNALEALIGAIYLDCGYKHAKRFIEHHLIENRLDIRDLSTSLASYKSALLEWAQKEKHLVRFTLSGCWGESHARKYQISVSINGKVNCAALGKSKKIASEVAAKQAYYALDLTHGKT